MRKRMMDKLGQAVSEEYLCLFTGRKIGEGCSRKVYECPLITNIVIKIELGRKFDNVAEKDIWDSVQGTKWEKWFCPVIDISYGGSILVMPKCTPLEELPKQIPSFFADVKLENWGMYKGRPVCVDYAHHRFYSTTLDTAKLVPSKKL